MQKQGGLYRPQVVAMYPKLHSAGDSLWSVGLQDPLGCYASSAAQQGLPSRPHLWSLWFS